MNVSVDGIVQSEPSIPLVDDRLEHQVEVTLLKKSVELLAAVDG